MFHLNKYHLNWILGAKKPPNIPTKGGAINPCPPGEKRPPQRPTWQGHVETTPKFATLGSDAWPIFRPKNEKKTSFRTNMAIEIHLFQQEMHLPMLDFPLLC